MFFCNYKIVEINDLLYKVRKYLFLSTSVHASSFIDLIECVCRKRDRLPGE